MNDPLEEDDMKNPICYVEIPADDLGALKTFYSDLFEWEYEKFPSEIEYYGVNHGEEKPGVGMMERQMPGQSPIFYVNVESVEAHVAKAEKLGAEVMVPISPVPGMGWFAVLMDPQKNPIGLWQDDTSAG
jgi:uncharacterized protein